MAEFLNKLTALSYEIVGVLLPGVIASICAIVVWASLGTFTPLMTHGAVDAYSLDILVKTLDALTKGRGVSAVILLLVVWYFAGYTLLWISHWGKAKYQGSRKPSGFERLKAALSFRFLHPSHYFTPTLTPLYERASRRLARGPRPLKWRQFYPVARTFVFENSQQSLITNYQHKYTLHRSITCAGVVIFWLEILIGLGALAFRGYAEVNWVLMVLTLIGSPVVIVGFSEGFIDNWLLWGDSIVTESFTLLTAPRLDRNPNAGPASSH